MTSFKDALRDFKNMTGSGMAAFVNDDIYLYIDDEWKKMVDLDRAVFTKALRSLYQSLYERNAPFGHNPGFGAGLIYDALCWTDTDPFTVEMMESMHKAMTEALKPDFDLMVIREILLKAGFSVSPVKGV